MAEPPVASPSRAYLRWRAWGGWSAAGFCSRRAVPSTKGLFPFWESTGDSPAESSRGDVPIRPHTSSSSLERFKALEVNPTRGEGPAT